MWCDVRAGFVWVCVGCVVCAQVLVLCGACVSVVMVCVWVFTGVRVYNTHSWTLTLTYTHSPVARTFFCAQRAHCVLHTSSCVSHTRVAHVAVKRCLHMCRFSLSRLLPSHVSPIFAVPARSLRDHSRQWLHWRSRPHVLAVLTCPKSAGRAQLRTCLAKFGNLAKSDANTGYEPKKSSTRILPWMMTRRSSTIRTTTCPTSRKPRTRTLANSVFTQCLNPLFCTFRFCSSDTKRKKARNRETVARQREREEREGFLISVAKSMSMKSRRNSI